MGRASPSGKAIATAVVTTLLSLSACGGGETAADGTTRVETETADESPVTTTVTTTVVRTVTQVETVTATQVAKPKPTPPRRSAPPVTTVTVPQNTADPEERTTGRPRFTIALRGASRQAEPGRRWAYVVRARKRNGKPAGGTAKMRVFADGKLVDTIGFFAFTGELRRTHVWPRSLSGKRVVLQAEVEGEGGTRRMNWPLTVE